MSDEGCTTSIKRPLRRPDVIGLGNGATEEGEGEVVARTGGGVFTVTGTEGGVGREDAADRGGLETAGGRGAGTGAGLAD